MDAKSSRKRTHARREPPRVAARQGLSADAPRNRESRPTEVTVAPTCFEPRTVTAMGSAYRRHTRANMKLFSRVLVAMIAAPAISIVDSVAHFANRPPAVRAPASGGWTTHADA